MTDKERLEEIKEQYDWTVTTSLQPILEDDDIIWLIQRAELIEKLEGDRKYWCDTYREQVELSRGQISVLKNRVDELEEERSYGLEQNQRLYNFNEVLKNENQRFKQVLEFYADKDNYIHHFTDDHVHYCSGVELDCGRLARKELEGEE